MKKLFKGRMGFTLIELIVVIAILGVLAAVLVPSIGNYVVKANMSAAKTNGINVLDVCERISAKIQTGEIPELTTAAIASESGINVSAGSAAQNDGIVVLINGNRVDAIWSEKAIN